MIPLVFSLVLLVQVTSEPEYAGVFYLLSSGDQMVDLERRHPEIKVKSNILTSST
jgi:hypothetical protein